MCCSYRAGTVDRPSVHDIVRDYALSLFSPTQLAERHAQLVELFRSNRPPGGWTFAAAPYSADVLFVYDYAALHMGCALEGMRPESTLETLALTWFDDANGGSVDTISHAAGSVLGWDRAKALAEAAASEGGWWTAAVRWSSLITLARKTQSIQSGIQCAKSAADLLHNKTFIDGEGPRSRDELELLQLEAVIKIIASFDPSLFEMYQPRLLVLQKTKAATDHLSNAMGCCFLNQFMTGVQTGDDTIMGEGILLMYGTCRTGVDNEFTAPLQEWEVKLASAMMFHHFYLGPTADQPTYDYKSMLGDNGATLIKSTKAYNYNEHHVYITNNENADPGMSTPATLMPVSSTRFPA